jgi:glycine/D-amino acid oxidase-like deaminating enzyme
MLYDVAVIGAGVFGAWTAHHLRQAGQQVVLLDAYGAANSRASSGGESRIIRMGYGADEIYTRSGYNSAIEPASRCFTGWVSSGPRPKATPTPKTRARLWKGAARILKC